MGKEQHASVDLRFEQFGWDYPHHNPLPEREVEWYLKFASQTGGPVLELACGTGRLLARLAREGFQITGLDISEAMLRLARRNVEALPEETRRRVRLIRGDMSNFHLDGPFGLIYIADNSLRMLSTREDMLACVRSAQSHLREEESSRFLVTERRFEASKYRGGRRAFGWSQPLRNPRTGEFVRRRGEFEICEDGQRMRGKFIYEVTHDDGHKTLVECPFEAPIMRTGDYVQLFAEVGFRTEVCAGYERKGDDGKNRILCFVCRKGT